MTDPIQIALWLRQLRDSGQLQSGTVVDVSGTGAGTRTVVIGDPAARAELREALLASLSGGGGLSALATGGIAFTGPLHGDITGVLDRLLTSMDPRSLQRSGGLGRMLQSSGGADSIRGHDPAFSEAGLVAEATAALWALTAARAENRPELVRRHLADAMYEREARQLQLDGLQGRRRVVEGLEVRSATIDECGAASIGDHATIRFRLWGADRDLDSGGRRVAGDRKPTDWHELWTLARPPGATTPAAGIPAPACATCGYAGADPAAAVCPGCGHPLPPAPGRWIVVGVTRVEPRHS